MARLLSYDPALRMDRRFRYDTTDESFVVETRMDVEPTLELNQAEFNAIDERTPWKGEFCRAARIPMNLVAELQRTGIWYDDDALRKWLDDPANRKWRTRGGRVSR